MRSFTCFAALLVMTAAAGQTYAAIPLPEVLYYKFNEGSGSVTANDASPGAGSNPATVIGETLNATGVFGSTALAGVGGTGRVSTGWATTLTSDFTIAFWHSGVTAAANGIQNFVMGDNVASQLRVFNGSPGFETSMTFRASFISDATITGLSATNNNHIAYVYDATAGNIKGYLNGVLNTTQNEPTLNLNGTNLFVGGREFGTNMAAGRWMDEFQLYSRALSDADVVDAMNANFVGAPEPGGAALLAIAGIGALRRRGARNARRY